LLFEHHFVQQELTDVDNQPGDEAAHDYTSKVKISHNQTGSVLWKSFSASLSVLSVKPHEITAETAEETQRIFN
jgi:hypothetical protein